ncbi:MULTISPECIES: hypothetical protein [Brevundimonas]|jgi:hypothetical protein|uniref:hypothetical protein n=1 Tax=Brevundimonas TaxID=41275 RepID=UPI00174AC729|nr:MULTISPECIES: hypothetical protein [Brevundimonas]
MGFSLTELKQGAGYRVEPTEEGFAILKSERDDAAAFDQLVREVLSSAGREFVALPRQDAGAGYDGVFILPFD